MTLKNTMIFFESLINETSRKSEIKVYQEFIQIIGSLDDRNLSESEIHVIEEKLDHLDLESSPRNRKKHYGKALREFKEYLKDTFSLTPKGYYTTLYTALGLSFGILFGVAILSNLDNSLGISLGLIGGMLIGSMLGHNKDAQVAAAGNTL